MNDKAVAHIFGKRLRSARILRRISQEDLAVEVGLFSRNQISQYERGVTLPSFPTLAKLASALNCSTDYLMGLSNRLRTASDILSKEEAALSVETVARSHTVYTVKMTVEQAKFFEFALPIANLCDIEGKGQTRAQAEHAFWLSLGSMIFAALPRLQEYAALFNVSSETRSTYEAFMVRLRLILPYALAKTNRHERDMPYPVEIVNKVRAYRRLWGAK